MNLKRHYWGPEVFVYIKDRLDELDDPLSLAVKQIDWHAGRVFSFWPANGITPPCDFHAELPTEPYDPLPIILAERDFVRDFTRGSDAIALFRSNIHEKDGAARAIGTTFGFRSRNEARGNILCPYLTSTGATDEEVRQALKGAALHPLICVLTEWKSAVHLRPGLVLSAEQTSSLVTRARHVILSAFGDDVWLIWSAGEKKYEP